MNAIIRCVLGIGRLGHAGADLLIAATALARDGTVVTGNVADFRPTGCRIEDPFA